MVATDRKRDGCSLFPDGIWRKCCDAHDDVYEWGGSWWARIVADWALRKCVRARCKAHASQKSDDWRVKAMVRSGPVGPFLMFLGVQVFGMGILPTPFRWGRLPPQP